MVMLTYQKRGAGGRTAVQVCVLPITMNAKKGKFLTSAIWDTVYSRMQQKKNKNPIISVTHLPPLPRKKIKKKRQAEGLGITNVQVDNPTFMQ